MIIPKGLYNTFFSTFGFNILKMAFPGCIFIWQNSKNFFLFFLFYMMFYLTSKKTENVYFYGYKRDLYCMQALFDQVNLKYFWHHWRIKEISELLILILDEIQTLVVSNWFLLWVLFQYITSKYCIKSRIKGFKYSQ